MTGDQSWFYYKQIGRKASNAVWTSIGGTPPNVVRSSRFAPKLYFASFSKRLV